MIFRVVILSLVLQSTNLSSLTLTNHRSVQPHAHQSVQRHHWWANRSAATDERIVAPPLMNKEASRRISKPCHPCSRRAATDHCRSSLTDTISLTFDPFQFFFWSILDFLFDQWVLGWWCLMMVGWWWWLGGLMVGVDWSMMVGEDEYFIWINVYNRQTDVCVF